MPRSKGNTYYKPSRMTILSGVTYMTRPSGTTITSAKVSGTTYATVPSGVTISKNQIAMSGGQVLPDTKQSAGALMATGSIAVAGVTKVEATYFGFTAITFCQAVAGVTSLMTGGVSGHLTVTTAKPIPAGGVSRVYFRFYTGAGAVNSKPISAQYFAIGV